MVIADDVFAYWLGVYSDIVLIVLYFRSMNLSFRYCSKLVYGWWLCLLF